VRAAPRERTAPRPSLPTQAAAIAPRPGLFASSGERAFVKAWRARDIAALRQVAADDPRTTFVCAVVLPPLLVNAGDFAGALEAARPAGEALGSLESDPLFAKYLSGTLVEVSIAAGVTATIRVDHTAIGLVYAELLQQTEHLTEAIAVAASLPAGDCETLSLADLYDEASEWDKAIAATDGVTAQDDITALTLVYRGIAFREKGLYEAARECFKAALASRKRDKAVRHKALFERAETYIREGKKALGRKDLEHIVAEDSDYPGVADALAGLGSAPDSGVSVAEGGTS
jgi:tetratricopeptide (TPR) repeat protein